MKRSVEEYQMTPEFPFLRGTFCLANSSVPYFQLSLSVAEALKFFRVARELIFDPSEIVLDELFQRDIDQLRVEKEIVPYLERSGEVKFFNSIVVVLLPHQNDRMQHSYDHRETHGSSERNGGIEIIPATENSGKISWDPKRIRPIVVDGQHRFCALREVAKNASSRLRRDLENTSIPIVLLALHDDLGFQASDNNLMSTVRKIFIDLNRQAKTVSETRNILLDDRDVAAVASRALLEKHVKSTQESLGTRLGRGYLPLALVDWYSDKLKFDHGVHVTSILALYKIISSFLNLPKLEPYDYEKAEKWGKRFLELDSDLDYKSTIESCIRDKRPIFLGSEEVRKFEAWFRASWGPAFVYVLTTLDPYQKLLGCLREQGFVDGPLEVWAAMDKGGKSAFENTFGDIDKIRTREGAVGGFKRDELAFQVVMQRGIFRAFVEMCEVQMASAEERTPLEYAKQWVSLFNKRLGPSTGNHEFWKGSVIRSDGSIVATQMAEKAVAAVIVISLTAPFPDWNSAKREQKNQRVRDYVDLYSTCGVRGLELWEKLKAKHGKVWRDSALKFVRETERVSGPKESVAVLNFMTERVLSSLGNYAGAGTTDEPSTDEDLRDFDPEIDDLDRWT